MEEFIRYLVAGSYQWKFEDNYLAVRLYVPRFRKKVWFYFDKPSTEAFENCINRLVRWCGYER